MQSSRFIKLIPCFVLVILELAAILTSPSKMSYGVGAIYFVILDPIILISLACGLLIVKGKKYPYLVLAVVSGLASLAAFLFAAYFGSEGAVLRLYVYCGLLALNIIVAVGFYAKWFHS